MNKSTICFASLILSIVVQVSAQNSSSDSTMAQRLEVDVAYLASDQLEGREAGRPGYDMAANYVASRFKSLGLLPIDSEQGYFQKVPMLEFSSASPHGGSFTTSGKAAVDLIAGEDYFVYADWRNNNGYVKAPLVFIGYGLVAPNYSRNDFKGLDVKNKIVVFPYAAPDFLPSDERAHYLSTIEQRASELGAIGSIVLYTPSFEELYSYTKLVEGVSNGSFMYWLDSNEQPFTLTPNLRASMIVSMKGVEKLFTKQKMKWQEIVDKIDSGADTLPGFEMDMTATIESKSKHKNIVSHNVVGILPGSDPKLKNEYLVLTAHLDHVGRHETTLVGDDEIFNGAMDNAVGVASVLEVANILSRSPPKRSIIFVALTAEEKGLVGSDYFAHNPTVPIESIAANINLDMPILNYEFTDLIVYGVERTTMETIIQGAAKKYNLTLTPDPTPEHGSFTRSDQYSFVKQGIPSVYLQLGHANGGKAAQEEFVSQHYHTQSDEIEWINFDAARLFTQVNAEIALGIANADARPQWNKGDFFGDTFGRSKDDKIVKQPIDVK